MQAESEQRIEIMNHQAELEAKADYRRMVLRDRAKFDQGNKEK